MITFKWFRLCPRLWMKGRVCLQLGGTLIVWSAGGAEDGGKAALRREGRRVREPGEEELQVGKKS